MRRDDFIDMWCRLLMMLAVVMAVVLGFVAAAGATEPDQGRSGAAWIDGRFMHASERPFLRW